MASSNQHATDIGTPKNISHNVCKGGVSPGNAGEIVKIKRKFRIPAAGPAAELVGGLAYDVN